MDASDGRSEKKEGARRGAHRGRMEVDPPVNTRPEKVLGSLKQGSSGKEIKVLSNHYKLVKKTNWSLYQYRVDFNPDEERTRIRKALFRVHKGVSIPNAYMFDGSMLFTIERLPVDIIELYSQRESDRTNIRITVKFTNELAFGDYQYIQLYNIILRNCIDLMQFQLVRRDYFDPNSSKVFEETMIGAVVFTYYNNKPYRVDGINYNIQPSFTFKKGDRQITLAQYYREKYDITITHYNQMILVSKPKARDRRGGLKEDILLIPELCYMTGLSEEMRTNFQLMSAVAEHTRVPPAQRVQRYYQFMNRMMNNDKIRENLELWNMGFSSSLEAIPARKLAPEAILFGKGITVNDHNGDWTPHLRNCLMISNVPLEEWVVITAKSSIYGRGNQKGGARGNSVENFIAELCKVANGLHYPISQPFIHYTDSDRIPDIAHAIEKEISTARYQLVMCIIQGNKPRLYSAIKKKCLCEHSVPSQVIATKTLSHRSLTSIATAIVIQMNCKLGGAPWYSSVPLTHNNVETANLICGYDVCHDPANKCGSIGAMVASLDMHFSKYFSSVTRN